MFNPCQDCVDYCDCSVCSYFPDECPGYLLDADGYCSRFICDVTFCYYLGCGNPENEED